MRIARFVLASFIFSAAVSAAPYNMMSNDIVIPGGGRVHGANGSFWITDLWLRSPGGGAVTLEFHAMDSASPAATATAVVAMTTSTVYLPDVLRNTFGLESGLGNFRVLSANPASATMRVYDQATGGASYGMSFMGMPSSMSMGSYSGIMGGDRDQYRYWIAGLLPEPQARVNVTVVNTSASPISGRVEILDADDGDPASGPRSLSFSIQPFSSHEFGDVLAGVQTRFSNGAGMQARIQLDDGSAGSMMAFATVMDNVSNDPYIVMGSMMDGQSSMMNGNNMGSP